MDNNKSLEFSILIHYKPTQNGMEFLGMREATWDENKNDLINNFQDTTEKMEVLIYADDLKDDPAERRIQIISALEENNWVNMTEQNLESEVNSLFV